jgi:hypothetical protein
MRPDPPRDPRTGLGERLEADFSNVLWGASWFRCFSELAPESQTPRLPVMRLLIRGLLPATIEKTQAKVDR